MSKPRFEQIADDISVLRVPCGSVATNIFLVGDKDVGWALIDSAHCAQAVDGFLVPALADCGLLPDDLSFLLCTHTHGDHVGGHRRIRELAPGVRILAAKQQTEKLSDPFRFAKAIRDAFPGYSPAPDPALRGVSPDGEISPGELLLDRLELIPTPGHDTDSVCFLDRKTQTLLCGDSLQGAGTPAQGLALYMDLDAYCETLARVSILRCENLAAGHAFLPYGDILSGEAAVNAFLDLSSETVVQYDAFIREQWQDGVSAPDIARGLLRETKSTVPPYLFLPLHTVTAHIRSLEQDAQEITN